MSYPRETVESVLFNEVKVNGVVTTDFTYQITLGLERPGLEPEDWSTPLNIGGQPGFILDARGKTPGRYKVWVKVGDIVIEAGHFLIS